jgi:hypothetical protein
MPALKPGVALTRATLPLLSVHSARGESVPLLRNGGRHVAGGHAALSGDQVPTQHVCAAAPPPPATACPRPSHAGLWAASLFPSQRARQLEQTREVLAPRRLKGHTGKCSGGLRDKEGRELGWSAACGLVSVCPQLVGCRPTQALSHACLRRCWASQRWRPGGRISLFASGMCKVACGCTASGTNAAR